MKALTLLITFCAFTNITYGQKTAEEDLFPEIAISKWFGLEGQEGVDLKGKTVILEFWATWCKPCIQAIPHINELSKYQSEEVLILSINSFEKEEVITDFMKETEFLTDVVMDQDKKTMNSLGVTLIPQTVIIDKTGRLRWKGDPGQLTDQLLSHFLEHDVILDEEEAPLREFDYDIKVTADRSVSTISLFTESNFGFSFKNKDIGTILSQLLSYSGYRENEINFVNQVPIEPHVDLIFHVDLEIPQNDAIGIAIENLKHNFQFRIDTVEEEQEILWLEISDLTLLKQHQSAEGTKYTRDKKEDMGLIKGSSIKQMNDILFYTFKKPLYTEETISFLFDYELYINDKEKTKTLLLEKYGIRLVEKKKAITVLAITFL